MILALLLLAGSLQAAPDLQQAYVPALEAARQAGQAIARWDEPVSLAYRDANGNLIVNLSMRANSPYWGFYWWPKGSRELYELRTRAGSQIDYDDRRPTRFDFFEPAFLPNDPFAWTLGDTKRMLVNCRRWPHDSYAEYSGVSSEERARLAKELDSGRYSFVAFPKNAEEIREPLHLFLAADPRAPEQENYIYVDKARWFDGPARVSFITIEDGKPRVVRSSMAHYDERTGVVSLNDGSSAEIHAAAATPFMVANPLMMALGRKTDLKAQPVGDYDRLAKLGVPPHPPGLEIEGVHTPCEPLLKP